MSVGVARVPVLPRKVAAGVSVFAVTRSGWAVAGLIYAVCVPGVVTLFIRLNLTAYLLEPLVGIGIMMFALALLIARPSTATLIIFIVLSALGDYLWIHGLLIAHPALLVMVLVLVNRPDTAMVLGGTTGERPLTTIAWGVGGFVAAIIATGVAELQLGQQFQLGNGPAISLANYSAIFLGLSIIQRSQRQRIPDFLQLRHETRRIEDVRSGQHRAAALLHDTVLNDLAFVINGPEILDARATARMLEDVHTLATTDLLEPAVARDVVDASDASLRNQMTQLVSDFQWRGLTVEFTGDTGTTAHMRPEAVTAAVGALRACLENVLKHSGANSAEIIVSTTEEFATWTVSDAGTGFDPKAVGGDRLGLKSSVFRRVESAGGVAKVWSRPGSGTSVLFSLPLLRGNSADD